MSAKLILSVNAGSSSLKISLYRLNHPVTLVLTESISNIYSPPVKFSWNSEKQEDTPDHATAFAHFLDHLKRDADIDSSQMTHICHRIVHGGDYTQRVIINDESYHHIETLSDLAPLHNAAALSVIKACIANIPSATSIAYFDTSFHRSIPPHIATYPIDPQIALQRGLKKYGFHGLSYSFILRAVSQYLQKPPSTLNLIVLHLGSGASACAIQNGVSLDTSMGLTPLNGLPGATRSGAVDPSLIFHYTNKAGRISHDPNLAVGLHLTEAEDILNRKSGWKALTGTTDFRVITERAHALPPSTPNPHRLAFDLFLDRILNYVGSYFLKLGGEVDALVFAGMIGEKSVELREAVGDKVRCLGFAGVDSEKNKRVGEGVVVDVGVEGKGKRLLVCRTDEQFEMARACALDEEFWKD